MLSSSSNPKKERTIEIKRVAEEWEIWNEEEAKKLVLEYFHKQIQIFGKKASEQMPIRKLQNHAIETKEGFVPRKSKVYLLSREEREEVHEFISKQLRKGYIEKRIYQTLKFALNGTGIFCRKEEQ